MTMLSRECSGIHRRAAGGTAGDRASDPVCGSVRPLIWWDRWFGERLPLAGAVDCPAALRVDGGAEGPALVVAASRANAAPLVVAGGSVVFFALLESASPEGPFTQTASLRCVTVPPDGLRVEPGGLLWCVPVGGVRGPWCKARLAVEGAVSGGVADVALAYRRCGKRRRAA